MCAQLYKKLLSKVAVRVAFPPAKYVGRLFSTSFATLDMVHLFGGRRSILIRAQGYVIFVLICVYLMTSDVGHRFMC